MDNRITWEGLGERRGRVEKEISTDSENKIKEHGHRIIKERWEGSKKIKHLRQKMGRIVKRIDG